MGRRLRLRNRSVANAFAATLKMRLTAWVLRFQAVLVYEHAVLDQAVRKVMRDVVLALLPDTSVEAAKRLFHERHIHGAPVVNEKGEPLGFLSASDLVSAAEKTRNQAQGHSRYFVLQKGEPLCSASYPDLAPEQQVGTITALMSAQALSVNVNDSVRSAVELMVRQELHRVLVLDGNHVAGVLSSMDVLRALVPDPGPKETSGF